MVCPKCGFDNPNENITCRVCGTHLATDSVVLSAASAPAEVTPAPTSMPVATGFSTTRAECQNHPGADMDLVCDGCASFFCKQCTGGGVVPPSGFSLCQSCFQEAVFRTDFCSECAVDMKFVEFVKKDDEGFWGKTGQCPKCNSLVQTRWLTFFFFPIIPLGSYRYREGLVRDEEEEQTHEIYQRGRTRMRWDQALRTAMFIYIPIGIIILILLTYSSVRPVVP